jgi:hypothetical protein
MSKRQPNEEANHDALIAMGWPLTIMQKDFTESIKIQSEMQLRIALHRLKIEDKVYGGWAHRVKALEAEILRRERAAGTIGTEA